MLLQQSIEPWCLLNTHVTPIL